MANLDTPEARGVVTAGSAGSATNVRGGLDQRRVLAAAIEFIDEYGLRELTMRRLGTHLGVEAMALYRYVPGRDALLDGVADAVIDKLDADPDVSLATSAGWREHLHRLAHGLRRIASAHPEVFGLVATRPTAAPWIRPPLRSPRWIEFFLATMTSAGLSADAAAASYRAFSAFLLGHLLSEASAQCVDTEPVQQCDPVPSTFDLDGYPVLRSLRPHLSRDHAQEDFEEALRALLDRLGMLAEHDSAAVDRR